MRFHHIIQNGAPFRTYEFYISGIFHLLFQTLLVTLKVKSEGVRVVREDTLIGLPAPGGLDPSRSCGGPRYCAWKGCCWV